MNEQFGEKVKAIFDSITVLQAKDSDLKRDNANINGDSPMGAMLQYGANTAKEYNLEYLIKPAIAELHRDGWIHIHDLDFYAWTTTCTQIELRKLFKNGFNTGHGHLRAPKASAHMLLWLPLPFSLIKMTSMVDRVSWTSIMLWPRVSVTPIKNT